ncbi:MAG: hypothetical protein FWG53_00730 [Clostridiales bacterium]|nr:hypothetical protein [Clostridiales bacterium]
MDSVISVSAGDYYSMAIKSDGSLWAWGDNYGGKLGDGTATRKAVNELGQKIIIVENNNRSTPVKIMDSVASVSAGSGHAMAIRTDGSLWAWGDNAWGQLGNYTQTNWHSPVKIMDSVVSISAGRLYSMAIKADGSLWAWGDNWQGQLGDGTTETRTAPTKIMDSVASVSAGLSFSMAITTDGSLWVFGNNLNSSLGDGTTENRLSPVKTKDSTVSVSVASNHTIALKSDGSLLAWGSNHSGQLGDGTTETRVIPIKIMDGVKLPGAILFQPSTGASSWAQAVPTLDRSILMGASRCGYCYCHRTCSALSAICIHTSHNSR